MLSQPDHVVTSHEQLRRLYRAPRGLAATKERDEIDPATRSFLHACPFVLVATVGADSSADASPRGGPPGFVQVLDATHLAIADLSGNNRLDTLENIVATGQIGLLFVIPGRGETVRLNGTAVITTDPHVLAGFPTELRVPTTAILVTVVTTFIHCAKAIHRSALWQPETWERYADAPDGSDIVVAQNPEIAGAGAVRASLDESYVADIAAERTSP